jgi:hypothetical protein
MAGSLSKAAGCIGLDDNPCDASPFMHPTGLPERRGNLEACVTHCAVIATTLSKVTGEKVTGATGPALQQ